MTITLSHFQLGALIVGAIALAVEIGLWCWLAGRDALLKEDRCVKDAYDLWRKR